VDKKHCDGSLANCQREGIIRLLSARVKGSRAKKIFYISIGSRGLVFGTFRFILVRYSVNSRVLHKAIHRKRE
jgi:hypothetical protein